MIPRQPAGENLPGANSGREFFLGDERRASVVSLPLSVSGVFYFMERSLHSIHQGRQQEENYEQPHAGLSCRQGKINPRLL